ncbi:MAG: hypothetical protein FJ344_07100 [Sphingomonadales bacterium]|nr:hypothetical protein [Sphingomonadales bacterium]
MNTPISIRNFIIALILGGLIASCSREEYVVYEVNPVEVQGVNYGKNKKKSVEQYISILYANLFQRALSANQLVEIRDLIESIGDQQVAFEIVLSNFMNRADVEIPTNNEMRADVDGFINDTYRRFLIRLPTEAERTWFRNYIQTHPFLTPQIIYMSFALSNEYQYY